MVQLFTVLLPLDKKSKFHDASPNMKNLSLSITDQIDAYDPKIVSLVNSREK